MPHADAKGPSPERQLAAFIARYAPEVATVARAALTRLRKRMPSAIRLVYDNYNALAVGFGPSERASEAILSIALYPRWVSLFFLQGARLADPLKRLRGSGRQVRHVVLEGAHTLDEPAVAALIDQALAAAAKPLATRGRGRVVVKSVSARQRPRRPAPAKS
jgi:hypothetical protein